ncbi:hypothetical protein J2W51_004003 [Tardiphaga robiniae]|uniref:hypothetical protein n=1 Tax=Tardiphaga robiniae TaxID=943830 RepID=UPI002861EAB1|nr:hypothetical protein [Tardiphaga robiniae]MDR6661417.1 hypothetical protein [Tardiphaga robiniae]
MVKFDDAALKIPRQIEPLSYTFASTLQSHLATANYLLVPTDNNLNDKENVREFHHNNSLWEAALIEKRLHHGRRIQLNSFFLFEWFPRSPGLYWTSKAREARADAGHRIVTATPGMIVYDPFGKQSMLDGGVGNIRLNPIIIDNREWMLMSASSSGTCHEGFPIALPVEIYDRCIDEIRMRGACVRTLAGKIKIIPHELSEIYSHYTNVPKFYLSVEICSAATEEKSRSMEELSVSLAVSFEGTVNNERGIYATYATHDPSIPRSFDDAIDWMQNTYVHSYNGKVLTDFDEHENHFPNVVFSLKKVMELKLKQSDFNSVKNVTFNINQLIAIQTSVSRNSHYEISGGQIGAVGDNARANIGRRSASTIRSKRKKRTLREE